MKNIKEMIILANINDSQTDSSSSDIIKYDELELSKKQFVFRSISKTTFDLAKQEKEANIILNSYINEIKILDSNNLEIQIPGIYNKKLVELGNSATIFINVDQLGVGNFKLVSYDTLGEIADSKDIEIISSVQNIEK
jgi:hypothetical protein